MKVLYFDGTIPEGRYRGKTVRGTTSTEKKQNLRILRNAKKFAQTKQSGTLSIRHWIQMGASHLERVRYT